MGENKSASGESLLTTLGGEDDRSISPWILALALALLTLLAFLPALDNGFVNFDDPRYATDTPWMEEGLSVVGVKWAFTNYYATFWHPLTVLSHMLDVELFGLNPRGHHLTSVLLHTVNVVLLFVVLRSLTGSLWRSLLVAALFSVHPLRVESVAWVAERKDVLSGFFGLLALLAYSNFVQRRSLGKYALVVLLFCLALMSKPMLVTLPCVLLLLDFWPLRRLSLENFSWQKLLVCTTEKLPLLILSVTTALLTISAQSPVIDVSRGASSGLKLANALVSNAMYVSKTVIPRDLAVLYPYPIEIPAWTIAVAGVFLGSLTALALIALRRAPYLAVGWLWFLGTLVPVSGLIQVGNQAMADRFSYLPAMGLTTAMVWGLHGLFGRRYSRGLSAVSLAAILSLVFLTRIQISYWKDSVHLFSHALEVTENNFIAHLNLAEALRAADQRQEAEVHYRAALGLQPEMDDAHAGLGEALRTWGRPQAALPHLETAIGLNPHNAKIHHSLAMTLVDLGQEDKAMEHLRAVLEIDPLYIAAHWGLADLLTRQGDRAEALRHMRAAQAIESLRTPSR
jgi:tetratricopeptide (TPR) repeat protein